MYGPSVGGGGLGRYCEQLIAELTHLEQKNRFVLFGSAFNTFQHHPLFEIVSTDIPWYSLKEQVALPQLIDQQHLDLIHFPHWNVPLRLKTPFVVTIHDLILLEEPKSARATTRHPFIYTLKYRGFKRVLSHAVHASQKIIAVSEATKTDILKHFPDISPEKIVVIYEGVTPLPPSPATTQPLPFPYILYVGNCYPHKNLEILLKTFDLLHSTFPDLHLVFAGRDDHFSRQMEVLSQISPNASFISFLRNPPDTDLTKLYTYARAYIFPSRIEGFGLPPLEAMSMGTPVVCSDIPSLREVLGKSAAYFSPHNPQHIADTIASVLQDENKRTQLIQLGLEQVKRYSWKTMAQEINRVYLSCEHPQI